MFAIIDRPSVESTIEEVQWILVTLEQQKFFREMFHFFRPFFTWVLNQK